MITESPYGEELKASFPKLEPFKVTKPGDFWHGLEVISTGAAALRDWTWAFEGTTPLVRPFLRATGERSTVMVCPTNSCSCLHKVCESERLGLIAVCCCDWACETVRLQPDDVAIYQLEKELIGGAMAQALGLGKHDAARYEGPGLYEIGRCAEAAAPVYLAMGDYYALMRGIGKVTCAREGPFLLLTPTGSSCEQDVERMVQQHGAGHISLSSVLDVRMGARGVEFVPNAAAAPSVRAFVDRVTKTRGGGAVLASIHREIASVRSDFVELRSAKQQLEKMLAEGFFTFMQKVDATSFKVLCTVLAEGDVAKAGRTLGMPDTSVRRIVRQWRSMGKEYRAMEDLVRWRKAVGRKETVVLSDRVLLGETKKSEYPELLADVLEKVTEMTGDNWEEKAEELEEMLREIVLNG